MQCGRFGPTQAGGEQELDEGSPISGDGTDECGDLGVGHEDGLPFPVGLGQLHTCGDVLGQFPPLDLQIEDARHKALDVADRLGGQVSAGISGSFARARWDAMVSMARRPATQSSIIFRVTWPMGHWSNVGRDVALPVAPVLVDRARLCVGRSS